MTGSSRGHHRAACLLSLPFCLFGVVAMAQRDDPGERTQPRIEDILRRAGSFVRETAQSQASAILADESYQQDVLSRPFGVNSRRILRRSIRSEALFVWLSAENKWVFVRNVLTVDGRGVPDSGERLDRLLSASDVDTASRLRQLQEESSRFNIGPVMRTIGDPTFSLRFLDPDSQSRFEFRRVGIEQVGGVQATKLAFDERVRPTIVIANGRDALTSGTMWVDGTEGTVVRTNMKLTTSAGTAESVTVDFQKNTNLQAWVPSQMSERYEERGGQTIICSASYANYRRFNVSVRVSTP